MPRPSPRDCARHRSRATCSAASSSATHRRSSRARPARRGGRSLRRRPCRARPRSCTRPRRTRSGRPPRASSRARARPRSRPCRRRRESHGSGGCGSCSARAPRAGGDPPSRPGRARSAPRPRRAAAPPGRSRSRTRSAWPGPAPPNRILRVRGTARRPRRDRVYRAARAGGGAAARDPAAARRPPSRGAPRRRRPPGGGARRGREALAAVAAPGEETRVADARDREALRAAFDGASVVASLAGPFLAIGPAPVEAALDAGAHWVDTSGEQAFARLVYERFADAGRAVLTSFGFDYVPGDLAARVAAEGLGPLDELVVAYSVKGFLPSRGTIATVGNVMAQPQVAYVDGSLVTSRFGATTRRVRFPFGERTVVEWGGTEPLTVPRHADVRTVRSYVRAPGVAARVAGLGRVAAPLVRIAARVAPSPREAWRARTRFTVVAEAHGSSGTGRATVTGSDVYLLTARLVATAAAALRAGEVERAGALAPAEAFDPRSLAARLDPLLRIE